MVSADSLFKKNPNIVARRIMDEFILVPAEDNVLNTQCIFSTNEVGGRIWELIDGKNLASDIAAALVREYDVEQDAALKDTIELLGKMLEKGCIEGPP